MNARVVVWLIFLVVASVAAGGYSYATPVFDAPNLWRVVLYALLGVLGLGLVFLMPRFRGWKLAVFGIWLPAIALRLLLLPTAPSDDVNRYLWEGRLVAEGISPYAQTADAESLKPLRDIYWQAMNHKGKATAYPPLSELAFAATAAVAYHPMTFKVVFVLADLAVLAAVLSLLRGRGLSEAYAGFYAFNPVVLISFAGEGHFDALMLAPLVWAVWAYQKKRTNLAVVLASLATGIKWVTLPLIPFFGFCRKPLDYVRVTVVAVLVLLLPALYFWDSLPALVGGLLDFGGTRSFNGPIYDTLQLGLELPRQVCTTIVLICFGLIVVWRWLQREQSTVDTHCRWIFGALIVLSPTVHFWYLAWILPFVCLRPSLPWLTLSVSSALYFFVWMNPDWELLLWQRALFWSPFFLSLLYEVWSTRGRVIFPVQRCLDDGDAVAVVIPTLNVEGPLKLALESLGAQTVRPVEIICVDAGSTDETRVVADRCELPVRIIESQKGRGQQIAAGIEAARAPWVCVLHADAVLAVSAIERIVKLVTADPTIIGGAMGQRFEGGQKELLPIEVLNDLRGLFTRTAFGDQVQFLHRATALEYQLMPKQPLMEDVESSWRMRELGGFAFMNAPSVVSHRSWKPSEWLKRFRLVMHLVARYRFTRLFNRANTESLSQELYQEYYQNEK
ncbi:MAG: glycosyltransferase [Opitutaceae bacterium]